MAHQTHMAHERRGPDRLAHATRGLAAPWRGVYFETVDSTQDEARRAARAGAPDKSVFVANYQRAGRGRQGRRWVAPAGTSLLLSVLFRQASRGRLPQRFTSLAALALIEAIEALLPGTSAAIKWPNDVLIDGRKVAGVLAESTTNGIELTIIVGIGVNVAIPVHDLAAPGATTLEAACGRAVDRADLLERFVRRLDAWLARPPSQLQAAWEARLWGRGQRLRLVDLGRDEDVIVLGVGADGSLRVRLADGAERVTTTGELIL